MEPFKVVVLDGQMFRIAYRRLLQDIKLLLKIFHFNPVMGILKIGMEVGWAGEMLLQVQIQCFLENG